MEDILSTDFKYVWYLHKRTLWQSHVCLVAYSGHLYFWVTSDLTKTTITIAGIDRFYWNLVFSLQLDVTLLLQNFAKIRHCLPEIWKCIQWFTFFSDTVYIHLTNHQPRSVLNLTHISPVQLRLGYTWLHFRELSRSGLTYLLT